MAKSENTTVRMSEAARRELSTVLKSHGMTQIEALGRVLSWFAQQSKTLQSLVLGNLDDDDEAGVIEVMYKRRVEALAERDHLRARDTVALSKSDPKVREQGILKKPRKNVATKR